MSRCIIHIGMHKTGTSSIQKSLNGYSDEAFVYANIDGSSNHSRALFKLFGFTPNLDLFGNPDLYASSRDKPLPNKGPDQEGMAALDQSIREVGERTFLLSGEGIALLRKEDLVTLRDYLRARFQKVTVVAAVRPPAAYMASAFQQAVKGARDVVDVPRLYRSYRHTFGKFDEVFGRENVLLWKFDPQIFPGGCAVLDFCRRLGIQLPAARIVRVNESISREATGLLFSFRKLGNALGSMIMTGPQNHKLVQQVMGIGNTRFRFSPDVVRPVLEQNRADIEWMEARLGQSLHEELGEQRAGDVRDEADLLTPDPEAVGKLRSLLGERAPAWLRGETPEQVALLVHALRGERVPGIKAWKRIIEAAKPKAGQRPRDNGETQMKVTELIEQIQQTNPKLLEGIPANRATALIRHVFRHMNETLAETEEGGVMFAGLGQFRVKRVEKDVQGEKVVRTQVVFRRAELEKAKNSSQPITN